MSTLNCVRAIKPGLPVLAAAIASALHGAVDAETVKLTNAFWFFDQGGYVQSNPSDFDVYQSTYGPNLRENTVTGSLGGASFTSRATMDTILGREGAGLQFSAIGTFTVEASVEADATGGLAQAYASLLGFGVQFSVMEKDHLYTGSEQLLGEGGAAFSSGSVLKPGTYAFDCFTCDSFVDTGFVGPGESVVERVTREFHFDFAPLPAPGVLAVGIVAAVLTGRRRRR